MKLYRLLLPLLLAVTSTLSAAELAGQWTAAFDTQIGVQKYVYTFAREGDHYTGKATYDHSMGKGTVDLKAVKVEGDSVSFTEALNVQGTELTITYTGTVTDDALALKRQVGDFATEQLTAHRAAPAAH